MFFDKCIPVDMLCCDILFGLLVADVHMIAKHMVLSCQGKDRAETASVWHRAESIFKVAKACVVLSAHVLALNDQADFAFLKLAVFAFDLVVKPGGENFVL